MQINGTQVVICSKVVLTYPEKKVYILMMADTYTIKTAQQRFSSLVQEAEDHPVTITRQGRAVAVIISIERMEAIAETMEVLADPKAMAAIRRHREGKAAYQPVSALDEL
jgi:prevent-host-death family protein